MSAGSAVVLRVAVALSLRFAVIYFPTDANGSNGGGDYVSKDNPSVFDTGHGPLSSADERKGGLAGAVAGGAVGYQTGGSSGAALGALVGWAVGEEVDD